MPQLNKPFTLAIVILSFCVSALLFAKPGDLDPAFGAGGKVTTQFPCEGDGFFKKVALAPDHKIIAMGSCLSNNTTHTDLAIARYNTDGSLDNTFGDQGKVVTNFVVDGESHDDELHAVAIQADGKIVVAGNIDGLIYPNPNHLLLLRYNLEGQLDPDFGNGGFIAKTLGGFIEAVAIQPDGKILIGGHYPDGYFLERYLPEGMIDPTFGVGGQVTASQPLLKSLADIKIQKDGKIVAAGGSVVARFLPDGTFDKSFGSLGIASCSSPWAVPVPACIASRIALQPDGKIVMVAYGSNGSLRLNTDGSLDESYGKGLPVTQFNNNNDYWQDIAVSGNEKIIMVGRMDNQFVVVQLNADGTPDQNFGDSGRVLTDFNTAQYTDDPWSVVIGSDNKIIAAGLTSIPPTNPDSGPSAIGALARYEGSPNPLHVPKINPPLNSWKRFRTFDFLRLK